MSRTKIAQHFYQMGQRAALTQLSNTTRTKTAAPKISRNQLAALLGGSAAAGAGGMGIRKLLQGMGGKELAATRGLTTDQLLTMYRKPAPGFTPNAPGLFDVPNDLTQALVTGAAKEQQAASAIRQLAAEGEAISAGLTDRLGTMSLGNRGFFDGLGGGFGTAVGLAPAAARSVGRHLELGRLAKQVQDQEIAKLLSKQAPGFTPKSPGLFDVPNDYVQALVTGANKAPATIPELEGFMNAFGLR